MPNQIEHYVIIIGAMKSGTTTLFSLLAEHPQIAPATAKEPGFFAFDEVHDQGFDWYHSLFEFDPTQHRYRLEASTDYTKLPFVTGVQDRMLARKQARYKLIYVMRDPADRLESHARHVQRTRREIGQYTSEKQDHSLDAGLSLPSLAMTQYAQQLDAFREFYDAGDVYLTTLTQLKRDSQRILDEIWAFLDLSPTPPVAQVPQKNQAGGPARQSPFWQKLSRFRILFVFGKKILSPDLQTKIKAYFRTKPRVEGRFKMTVNERMAVQAIFAPELERLSTTYKTDLEASQTSAKS